MFMYAPCGVNNGRFQKISKPIPEMAFRISMGKRGFYELEFKRLVGYL